jgi:hypothetical protein
MPVAASPKYGATFSINFFPNSSVGGGTAPHVIPSVDSTDSQGRLYASIVSGTQSGVIELVAQIVLANGKYNNFATCENYCACRISRSKSFYTYERADLFSPSMDYLYTPYPHLQWQLVIHLAIQLA